MELYGQKDKSIIQKSIVITAESILLWLSFTILIKDGEISYIFRLSGIENSSAPFQRRVIIFIFSVIVFIRIGFAMIFLVKRKIPAVECISVTFVFGIYYIGFSLLSLNSESPSEVTQYTGIFIFTIGSFLNTYSEIQRHFFKKKPENKGKLYSDGLFRYSIHINYFGDILWVTGYAIVTQNFYSYLIPFSLLCFFVFYNIPELDDYLKKNYGSQFDEYSINTKKLIPYIY